MAKERHPVGDRPPKNPNEAKLFKILNSDGWRVTKQGWPDFACFKDNGEFMLVEVKNSRDHRLKRMQYKLMLALAQAGIRCYLWSPDGSFELVTTDIQHVERK